MLVTATRVPRAWGIRALFWPDANERDSGISNAIRELNKLVTVVRRYADINLIQSHDAWRETSEQNFGGNTGAGGRSPLPIDHSCRAAQAIERSGTTGFDGAVHCAEADCIDVNNLARNGGRFLRRGAPVLPVGGLTFIQPRGPRHESLGEEVG